MSKPPRIAIIGAGISGLTLARTLGDVAQVEVFEKARGVGGRMSTRYADPFYFDHGTPYFTARGKEFWQFLLPLVKQGLVAEWTGKVVTLEAGKKPTDRIWFEPHYVAVPGMNQLCKHLACGLSIHLNTEVTPLAARRATGWELSNTQGEALGTFDWVISTAPPVQTMRLLGSHTDTARLATRPMLGCYTLMLGWKTPWDKPWIGAKLNDEALAWVSINSSKPGRNAALSCVVVHAREDWSEQHIDDDIPAAQAFLLQRLKAITGMDGASADYCTTHRWRYATTATKASRDVLFDRAQQLGCVGDWGSRARVEDAWGNAVALAELLRQQLTA